MIVKGFLKAVGLSFFDRLLGGLFGLVRGSIVCIALLTGYMAFGRIGNGKAAPAAVVHSEIAPFLLEASHIVVNAAPAELKSSFSAEYDRVKSAIRSLAQPSEDNGGKKGTG